MDVLDAIDVIDGIRQRRPRRIRERVDFFQINDDIDLVSRFRFRRNDIDFIVNIIEDDIRHNTDKNHALSPSQQLLVALRFYASGSFYNVIGDSIHVSAPTVCQIIRRVSLALSARLDAHVNISNVPEYARQMKAKFSDMAGFPGVLFCIDGSHIEIQAPSEDENDYVNRKGRHSINVQFMCDADLRIVNTVIRWPGSTHDSRMLRNSAVYGEFENGQYNGYVLGDSAYPSLPWLLTPFLAPASRAEEAYNQAQTKTRQTIERCIGVLKRRFCCLKFLRMEPARAVHVIAACTVLHNIAVNRRVPLPMEDEQDDGMDNDGNDDQRGRNVIDANRNGRVDGRAVRARIVQRHFTRA